MYNLSTLSTSQGGSEQHDQQPGSQQSRDLFTQCQMSHVNSNTGHSIQNDFSQQHCMAHMNLSIRCSLDNDSGFPGERRASCTALYPNTTCRLFEDEIPYVDMYPSHPVGYDDFPQNADTDHILDGPSNPQQSTTLAIHIPDHVDVDQISPIRHNAEVVNFAEATQLNRCGANTNNADIRSRMMNVPQEQRKENINQIVETVLPERDGDNLYIGYSMLLQFAKTTESKIYNTVNGMNEYHYYARETVDIVKRAFEEWKREQPDKEFNILTDLYGMNMQDFIDKAAKKSAFVLTNAITTLFSENTSTITQSSTSTSGVSNDNQTRSGTSNNRYQPYPSTSGISTRRTRNHRSRQHVKAYSVCFYSKTDLPSRSQRCRIILEAVLDILLDDSENDIRNKLTDILEVKHGYHFVTENDLVFLKSARRQLDLPVSPPGCQWNGDKLRRLIGNGKLHVMVQVHGQMDSSLGRSCSFFKCERNDPRRRQLNESSSSEFSSDDSICWTDDDDSLDNMEEEEAMNEAIRRSLGDQGGASVYIYGI